MNLPLPSSSKSDNYTNFIQKMNQVICHEHRLFSLYWLFAHIVSGIHQASLSAQFMAHADHGHTHALQLARRIEQLGDKPICTTQSWIDSAQSIPCLGKSYDLKGMLRELIQEEREMIYLYRELLLLSKPSDSITRQLLQSVMKEDKQHELDLAGYIFEIDRTIDRLSKDEVFYTSH